MRYFVSVYITNTARYDYDTKDFWRTRATSLLCLSHYPVGISKSLTIFIVKRISVQNNSLLNPRIEAVHQIRTLHVLYFRNPIIISLGL